MSRILRIAAIVLLPVLTFAVGWQVAWRTAEGRLQTEYGNIAELFGKTGSGQIVKGDPEKEVDIALLWSVWRLLQRHYIHPEELDTQKLVYGAVGGLVSGIGDPYTVFMTPTDTKAFDDAMQGTLEGIGAQLELKDGLIIVVAPVKGSPAEKAGLLPNDLITAVNGAKTDGKRLDEVVRLIRGPKGTTVVLTLVRASKRAPFDVTVERDSIHIPSVESHIEKTEKGDIGVIALNQFGDSSMAEFRKALLAFPKNIKGVVLDLRYNGGGYLEGAVELVSMFQTTGKVVTVEHRGGNTEEHSVTGQPILPALPLVVLINEGSASASEITAGALQDSDRATIIGVQSFGKGTVQEVLDLPGGAALRVTNARWLTPLGTDLGKKGITPDIVVEEKPEQFQSKDDPQLKKALEEILTKSAS